MGAADVPRSVTDAAGCADLFAELARSARPRAPVYSRLASGLAADASLAGILLAAPPLQRQPVLLLACVHDLLLAGRDDVGLRRFYPNLTATPDDGDPAPTLRAFCGAHRDELTALVANRRTQTNEVGRCALLVPALALVADEVGAVAHLDVGASAGLNLLVDRYHYTYEPGGDRGGPSPVHLRCAARGDVPLPAALPVVAERRGLDRAPVDVRDPTAARWLEACVWPDQTDRFERLAAAIGVARTVDLAVELGDAVADTAALVAAAGAHPVVTTTWVMAYLAADERAAFLDALDACGRWRDLSWVFAESPALVPDLPVPDRRQSTSALVLVRWRRGRRRVHQLASCHPHGYWLQWR